MVLCKDIQPQGIRELWDLVKSSNLVHGVTGRDSSRRIAFVKIWRIGRCKLEKIFQKFLPGDSYNVDAEGKPRPAQSRNGTVTIQHFPPTPTASRWDRAISRSWETNLCFKIISHFIMVGYEEILIYKMTLKYWEQKLWVFFFFFFSSFIFPVCLNIALTVSPLQERRDYAERLNGRC